MNKFTRLSAIMVAIMAVVMAQSCSDSDDEKTKQGHETAHPSVTIDGEALYITHCSGCHGIAGDGKGKTELKRPARSFAAGGFAFGNTPEALFKTITSGLPGISEMPSFAAKMNDAERRAVVSHVRTLIPKQKQVDDTATIMLVENRPRIFRGILPPVAEGLPLRPRGLLVGLPGGVTFEYRIDEPRMLAVRTGGFVKRTDWTGRAGTAAMPTGQVRFLFDGGNPGPLFYAIKRDGMLALKTHMKGSFAFDDLAGISYELENEDSNGRITIKEAPFAQDLTKAFGFGRRFLLGPSKRDFVIQFETSPNQPKWENLDINKSDAHPVFPSAPLPQLKPLVRKFKDGSALILVHNGNKDIRVGCDPKRTALLVPASRMPRELAVIFIKVEKYSMKTLEALATEVRW